MVPPPRSSAYRDLAADLRAQLQAGEYADGRKLPTENELATTHRVSRQTVRRAMQELVAEGVIYRVAGRGTFATSEPQAYIRHIGSVEDLMGLSQDTDLEIVVPLARRIDVDVAGRLGQATDEVHSVTFVRRHDGTPFCLTVVALPPSVGQLLAGIDELTTRGAHSTATVIGLIDERLDRPITTADQSITATVAPAWVHEHLGVSATQPVLRIDRLYCDGEGVPVELAISYFLPEFYSYRVQLRRHLA